jgi:hypothetical protein
MWEWRWREYTETSNVGVGAVGAGAVEVGDGVEGDPWRGHVRLAGWMEAGSVYCEMVVVRRKEMGHRDVGK